ncbi:hypothetical protein [Absidia glauca]|uniref:MULE transposase domain-containing protein n=1 Tax=Absidia glauca TaxID=4829 RepID=A0A163KZP8_ABSGL|nr:hypothetical protein [Absidia glauca]
MITLDELDDHYFDLSGDDYDDDDENNICVDGHLYLDDSQINNTNTEIIASFFDKVEQVSGYKYTSMGVTNPRKRRSIAFYGWCSQRTDVNRQIPDDQTRRFCNRMETYDCGGELKGILYKNQRWAVLTIKHGSSHPCHQEDRQPQMSLEVRNIIAANSNNNTSPALYRLVQRTFGPEATRSQVAFWRQQAMEANYRMDDDQFVSSKMLVESFGNQGFDQVVWEETLTWKGFGFTTPFFDLCVQSESVVEYHVDSTFKTNRLSCELFGVIANINGAGFPVAYFLFKHSRSLLGTKRGRLGQIYNEEVAHGEFDFVDRQFLPHINNNNNEANIIVCVAARRKDIKAIMHRHYCYHSLIPQGTTFKTAAQIHYDSAQEMYNFCAKNQLSDSWAYLYRRWYTAAMWKLWARGGVDHIPNGKSTMMIESHWRVLKRNHLHYNNRPRLDYLVYTITQKQCTDLLFDYEQKVILCRDFFQWEGDFNKEWNRSITEMGSRPNTNHPGRINIPSHDNIIIIDSSDSEDGGDGANEGVEGNVGAAGFEESVGATGVGEESVGPAVVEEDVEENVGATANEEGVKENVGAAGVEEGDDSEYLGMENLLASNRRRKRDAVQRFEEYLAMIEDLDGEFAQKSETYASRLPRAQADVFRNATNVEEYLETVTRFRRRKTMPRTYGDFNPYTYNL